jgi:hypothetical protein
MEMSTIGLPSTAHPMPDFQNVTKSIVFAVLSIKHEPFLVRTTG